MMMPDSILSLEYRDRLRALAEHVFFAAWGYYVIIKQPTGSITTTSLLFYNEMNTIYMIYTLQQFLF